MAHHFRKRKTIGEMARTPVVLALLFFVALFLLAQAWDLFGRARGAHDAATEAQAEYDALSARKADLQQKIAHIGTPEGVDVELREKFGVVKDGEEVVVVVPEGSSTQTGVDEKAGLWYKFLGLFGQN